MRYATKAVLVMQDEWGGQIFGAEVVHEQDRSPVSTGLVNAKGEALYRVHETVPIDFHPHRGKR